MAKIRVATAQLKGETLNTLEKFMAYFETFLTNNALIDILVLPEYALLPVLQDAENITRAETRRFYDEEFMALDQPVKKFFQELANRFDTHILVGSQWVLEGQSPYNAAYFFTPQKPLQIFPKCNPTPPESAMAMQAGERPGFVTLNNGVKAGILICFDVEFPELARDLCLQGADILLVPSLTLNERGAARVEICARARAIENQVYVVSSTNQSYLNIPVEKPIRAVGRAGIFGPIDNKTRLTDGVIIRAETEGDSILVAELDMDILEQSRFYSEAPLRKNVKRVLENETL